MCWGMHCPDWSFSKQKLERLPVRHSVLSPLPIQSSQSLRVLWWESSRSTEKEGCWNACIHLTWEGPFQTRTVENFFFSKQKLWEDWIPFSLLGASKGKAQEIFVVCWCVAACKGTSFHCISQDQCTLFQLHCGLNVLLWGNLRKSLPFITPFLCKHVFQVPKRKFRN